MVTLSQLITQRDSFPRGSPEAQAINARINAGDYTTTTTTRKKSPPPPPPPPPLEPEPTPPPPIPEPPLPVTITSKPVTTTSTRLHTEPGETERPDIAARDTPTLTPPPVIVKPPPPPEVLQEPKRDSSIDTSGLISAEERIKSDPDTFNLILEDAPISKSVSTEQLALEERETAFQEAQVISEKISSLPLDPKFTEVVHLETPMSLEQFQTDFPEAEPSGPMSEEAKAQVSKVDAAILEKLQEAETAVLDLRDDFVTAGKELGSQAEESWKEGDYLGAIAEGVAAASARAGAGVIEGASIVNPLTIGKTAAGILKGAGEAIDNPEDIPGGIEKWVENIKKDPGSIAQFAGNLALDYAVGSAIQTIKGKSTVLSRLDDVDINVKSTTLKLVDDTDNIMGTPSKTLQFPEAEISPTISKKKIPSDIGELMAAELDDIPGTGRLLGVADDTGITSLEKIDMPEGVLDDLISGKKTTVKGVIETENIALGHEPTLSVKEFDNTLTSTKKLIAQEDNALFIDAKEMGPTLNMIEDASPLKTLSMEGDELKFTPPPDVQTGSVKFKSLWGDEGVKGFLDEGEHSYKVVGVEFDAPPLVIDDILDPIKPIKPTPGPKTAFAETFQQPGYTGTLKEVSKNLADDIEIVRELTDGAKPTMRSPSLIDDAKQISEVSLIDDLTQGTAPLAKISLEPPTFPKEVVAGLGIGAALIDKDLPTLKTVKPPKKGTGPPGPFDDIGPMPGTLDSPPKPEKDRFKLPNPYFKDPLELARENDPKLKPKDPFPLIIEDPKIDTPPKIPPPIPILIPKPSPKSKPKDPPPFLIVDPILDVPPIIIQVPKLDDTLKSTTIQITDTITKTKTPYFPPYLGSSRRKPPQDPPLIKKKKRPDPFLFSPLKIGFEDRKYRIRTPQEMMGTRRSHRKTKSILGMPQLPDSFSLTKPKKNTPPKTKKKRRKKK